jgi:hypothetical protein
MDAHRFPSLMRVSPFSRHRADVPDERASQPRHHRRASITTHRDHHYSVTVRTLDPAVLYCLRALADFAQKDRQHADPVGWNNPRGLGPRRQEGDFHFRFSKARYREGFLADAGRVLPSGSYQVVTQSDNDPARPIRSARGIGARM